MLSKLRRKFHAVKYQFSVNLESLEPWPRDDCGVSVFWQRGQKKSKRGQTTQVVPVDVDGKPRCAVVPIQQSFKLSATLYADATKHKQTGPYEKKECKLFIMQMAEDGEKLALLGKASINLADIAKPMETTLELPVDCDADIKRAVGRPKLILRCRAWYKGSGGPGSMSSTTSGLSAMSGFTEDTGSHSDPSTMSSEPTKHKATGILTSEQQTSLEGFDNRAGMLDSIQEIVATVPGGGKEEDIVDSAESMENAEKEMIEEKPAAAENVAVSIDEDATKEPVTVADAPKVKDDLEDSAHGDPNDSNPAEVIEKTKSDIEVQLDAWTMGKGVKSVENTPKAENKRTEAALGDAMVDWWSMVVSLLTCMPPRPRNA